MTSSGGFRTKLVSVTVHVGIFLHFNSKGKAIPTRAMGGIRQRAHPQWLQQRRHNHHATHVAQRLCAASTARTKLGRRRSGSSRQRLKEKSSGDEFWNLGGRSMHRYGSLAAPLSCARAGVRLQPAPAAAPSNKSYNPDSGRLVCRSRGGPLRAGTSFPVMKEQLGSRVFWH